MVKYGFFNAKKLITGDYDRKYNADDVNAYFKGAISRDGIYQFVGSQCRVIPAGNMNVYVRDGKGQINYHWFELTSNELVSIREAHATLNRWTAIVARYDAANRNIYLITIDGTDSEHPSKPQIQRTDTLRDICLAYVYVAAGTTEITRDDIEDTVEDIEVCGFVETLLKSDSAAVKVHQLPIPSKSCQGNIYYLIEESKTAGKTYIKGYYYCEPSRTEYDFIDFDWTSDTLANRPVASEDYINILYFANDNNKWYQCVEVSENTFEWQEVTVNEVEELPEPTEELNNQFYIIGNTLYKVAKQESNYKWYMFGTGGGGGHGDFAIIRIEYPEGTEVQVTFDDDTVDAPDTSGVWIYGCDKAGTYVVGIKNTTITQSVEITAAGQVEEIFISPQVINYALLYYLGNEFTNVAGTDEERYAISTGGWGTTLNNTVINSSGAAGQKFRQARASTLLNINATNYSFIGSYVKEIKVKDMSGGQHWQFSIGCDFLNSHQYMPTTPYYIFQNVYYSKLGVRTFTGFIVNQITAVNKAINICVESSCNTYGDSNSLASLNSNHIELFSLYDTSGLGSIGERIYTYSLFLYNQDDISGLSDYGSDIATILSNASNLFTDTTALNWMCLNCTGDFMISALSNTNFVNAMNTSSNKTILTANEHWARFIALLSV